MKQLLPSKTTGGPLPILPSTIVWVSSFGSVAALLLHLPGILTMRDAAVFITLPALIAISVVTFRQWSVGSPSSREFLLRIKLGGIGGLIGTIGYDLVRIPFHYAGLNPLSPIQAYGMWATGFEQADTFSHTVGFLYHLSNGITFGWIYSLLMVRRSWAWAVVWAMLLETLAILSPFGSVFALRSYSGAVTLAFFAHLFYGIPLGLICQNPGSGRLFTLRRSASTAALLISTIALTVWFVGDANDWNRRPENLNQSIVIDTNGISPAWSNFQVGTTLKLSHSGEDEITVKMRHSGGSRTPEDIVLRPGKDEEIQLDKPGIYQVGVPGAPYRSVFLSVHRDGDYRLQILP